MSLISMISMEVLMNIVDVVLTGGAADFMGHNSDVGRRTPDPLAYNYWRLKYGVACH